MSKVTGPLGSLDASGSIANTLVFSKWKGRNYVRLLVTPKNPMSDGQAEARTKLGVLGKALSFVFFGAGPDFYTASLAKAPAGQSWISFCMKEMLGTNASQFDTVHSAYAGIGGTPQGLYDTAGEALGLSDFSLSYGSYGTITAGETLYHMLAFALSVLSYTLSAGTLNSPDAGGLSDFNDYISM